MAEAEVGGMVVHRVLLLMGRAAARVFDSALGGGGYAVGWCGRLHLVEGRRNEERTKRRTEVRLKKVSLLSFSHGRRETRDAFCTLPTNCLCSRL